MSIASALSDIATNLTTILGQINTKLTAKGVTTGAETLAEVPDKIDTISVGTGIVPTGDKNIDTNGTHDVTDFANAVVNVPTGTARTSNDVTVSGRTVTVPAGLYSSQVQKSVESATQATPSLSVDTTNGIVTATSTQSAGFVASGTTSRTLDLKTIDTANFNENNIRNGVTIFGKTGNYGGGSASSVYIKTQYSVVAAGTTNMNISGLPVDNNETLVGLVLITDTSDTTYNMYIDEMVLLPANGGGSGWMGVGTTYISKTTFFIDYGFAFTKSGETGGQLTSTGAMKFVGSYQVHPIVMTA